MPWNTSFQPMVPEKVWPIQPCEPQMPAILPAGLSMSPKMSLSMTMIATRTEGVWVRSNDDIAGQSMTVRLYGRLGAENIIDPNTGEILAERNDVLDHDLVRRVCERRHRGYQSSFSTYLRANHGICARCYGLDLGRGKMVEVGSAVGIVAAQSIGEPGTQLTLRTFHTGGVAAGGDITTGLPRVEELFEARRRQKAKQLLLRSAVYVHSVQSDRYSDLRIAHVEHSEMISDEYNIPEGWKIAVEDGGEISQGDVLAYLGEEAQIIAQNTGRVRIEPGIPATDHPERVKVFVSYESRQEETYDIPSTARMVVRDG